MINRFIRGLRADLKQLIRVLRADYSLPNAFQDYVEGAGAQCDAHRALVGKTLPSRPGSGSAASMRPKLKTTTPRRVTPVYNVETEQINCDDRVYQALARFVEEHGEVFVTQVTEDRAARVPTGEL